MKTNLTLVALCLSLSGCFETFTAVPAAREQARVTISLLAELEEASKEFKAVHTTTAAYLADANARRAGSQLKARGMLSEQSAGMEAAAEPAAFEVRKRMATLIAQLEKLNADQLAADKLDEQTRALLKPMPDLASEMAGPKKALAALQEDVSTAVRLRELKAFYEIARKSTKDAKDKLKEAAAPNEAAAPAPGP